MFKKLKRHMPLLRNEGAKQRKVCDIQTVSPIPPRPSSPPERPRGRSRERPKAWVVRLRDDVTQPPRGDDRFAPASAHVDGGRYPHFDLPRRGGDRIASTSAHIDGGRYPHFDPPRRPVDGHFAVSTGINDGFHTSPHAVHEVATHNTQPEIARLSSPTPALQPIDSMENWAGDAVSILDVDAAATTTAKTVHIAPGPCCCAAQCRCVPAELQSKARTSVDEPGVVWVHDGERLQRALLMTKKLGSQIRDVAEVLRRIEEEMARMDESRMVAAANKVTVEVKAFPMPGAWIGDHGEPVPEVLNELVGDVSEDCHQSQMEDLAREMVDTVGSVLGALGKAWDTVTVGQSDLASI